MYKLIQVSISQTILDLRFSDTSENDILLYIKGVNSALNSVDCHFNYLSEEDSINSYGIFKGKSDTIFDERAYRNSSLYAKGYDDVSRKLTLDYNV